MLISYRKRTLLIFTFIICISKSYKNHNRVERHEYLMKSDLIVLLKSLEKLIRFTNFNDVEPNLNYIFGIFLISVNLERVLMIDDYDLEFYVRQYMTQLLQTNNRNLNSLTEDLLMFGKEQDMNIFVGMNPNVPVWARRLNKIKMHSRNERKQTTKTKNKLSWLEYKAKITNDQLGVPSPKMSDKCLMSFFHAPIVYYKEFFQCEVDKICHYVIQNGTNVGYALTHRLLSLLIAHLGRGCNIFAPEEDLRLTKEFCWNIYEEAIIIAGKKMFSMDLLMEQIALCSLTGHGMFFRRSWFLEMIRYQSMEGCFSKYHSGSRRKQRIEDISSCGEHTTSVAAGALSAAVRFIIETFY